jgi:hypothetical protein
MSDFSVEYAADAAIDEQSFVKFLKLVLTDRENQLQGNTEVSRLIGPYDPWTNVFTAGFLQAAITWSELSRNGASHYDVPVNAWTRMAHIVLAGLIQPD